MGDAVDGTVALLSERLLAALTLEVEALDSGPAERRARAGAKAGTGAAKGDSAVAEAGGKARVEAISLLTRTLEKLLELKRLEAQAMRIDGDEDAAETERLRTELLKRLRAMDASRPAGPRLFGPDGRFLQTEPGR